AASELHFHPHTQSLANPHHHLSAIHTHWRSGTMASAAALSESMQRITKSKLDALQSQHSTYEMKKTATVDAVRKEENLSTQLGLLLDALTNHDVPVAVPNLIPDNVRRFVNQRRNDPSVSTAMLEEWKSDIEQCLDIHSRKFEHASLFGQLVTEWLQKPNDTLQTGSSSSTDSSDDASSENFEQVGRQEMYDQRKEWESLVFDSTQKSDPEKIQGYLSTVFDATKRSKKITKTPLEIFRATMRDFDTDRFDLASMKWCIAGLLKVDILVPSKRTALSEIKSNDTVLNEMVDVLNIQLDEIDQWSWGDQPIPIEMRRQTNGRYRVYMNEEIMQALLLQFIGMKSMDKEHRLRRRDFLNEPTNKSKAGGVRPTNVHTQRMKDFEQDYFMTQLPSSVEKGTRAYGDVDSDTDSDDEDEKSPMEIKQSLLSLVTTESLINTSLYGSFAVVQSDFRWFGPSLPHASMFAVLKFFGVKDSWIQFFRRFLEAPLSFAQDGPEAAVNIRRSGVPIEHALSDILSEAVLFCLDFAVNQATKGNLYRFHDDLWYWGQEQGCVDAWKTIEGFAKVMGLSMNEKKTGSAIVRQGQSGSSKATNLPHGKVRWGFLTFDSSVKWTINEDEVDQHIEEFQRQLKACGSVLAVVQAWNVYVSRFLANNFGHPKRCLGQQHIDMVISTFEKIQKRLFAGKSGKGNLVEHLRSIIAERFGVQGLPDGFFYFPVEFGGLGLANPMIPLLTSREVPGPGNGEDEDKVKGPEYWIQEAFEEEEKDYQEKKKRYDEGESTRPERLVNEPFMTYEEFNEPFMTYEEFTQFREETSSPLRLAYTSLQRPIRVEDIKLSANVKNALYKLPRDGKSEGVMQADFNKMSEYWKWVAQLYGGDVIKRFGGMRMGEKKLLPVGLVTMLRQEKVRWQG
ncbi:MAG: hypothetical protein Q9174_001468, partial [Haloplaca sp. 1 TL-2023]